MFKRRVKPLQTVLLARLGLVLALLLIERLRGQIGLSRYKRELAARGETLEIQKLLAPPVADADNGAPELLRLKPLFKEGKVIPKNFPPKMRLMTSGRAVVGFREDSWTEDKSTNTWEEVSLDLAANQPTLEQLRVALAKPAFDFKLDHSRGFEMDFTHIAPAKSYCQWLGATVQHSLRKGENQVALEDLVAAVGIPRVLENDRIMISELVRDAISAINLGTTWEALQAGGWTDEQLTRLQAAWERNTFATNMVRSLRVERADGDTYFERFRKSNDETYQHMFPAWLQGLIETEDAEVSPWWQSEFLRKQIYCRVWRFAWLHQDEKFYLEGLQQLIEDQSTGAEKAAGSAEEYWFGLGKAPRQNFYDGWRFGMSAQELGALSRATVKSARAETDRSMVLCAIALKRYLLRHGEPAPNLNALVPDFLAVVPVDCMDGQPLRYRRLEESQFTLYSVGDDGHDDGGDAFLKPEAKLMRDPWQRRDHVWPAVATAEEAAAWRRDAVDGNQSVASPKGGTEKHR